MNEEAVDWLNSLECPLEHFPITFLLQHSQYGIDELARTAWDNREEQLRRFATAESPLWVPTGKSGSLDHSQILTWMKSPKPKDIVRFYRHYGIPKIFHAITRNAGTRSRLYLDLTELVEKRNAIAHGDATVEALPADITRYLGSVEKFTRSADLQLAKKAQKISQASVQPW